MAVVAVVPAEVGAVFSDSAMAEIYTCIAGETITKGDALYITTAGLLGACNTGDSGEQQFRGIALTAGGTGAAIDFIVHGCVEGFTLTGDAESFVYAADTDGVLRDTAGTMTVVAGRVFRLTDNDRTKVLYVDVRWDANWTP